MGRLFFFALIIVVAAFSGCLSIQETTPAVTVNDTALLNLFIRDIITDEMIAEQVNTVRKYDFKAKLPASALVGGREA